MKKFLINKTCTSCHIEKNTESDFYFDNYNGRYRSKCKECEKARTRKYISDHYQEVRQKERNYRIINREEYRKKKLQKWHERYNSDHEFREAHIQKSRKFASSKDGHAYAKYRYHKGFEVGDDVFYQGIKYKIKEVVRGHGFRIRRYGQDDSLILIPRKLLIPCEIKRTH